MIISLDGMGGDAAPQIVVDGAALALERQPTLKFLLFGDQERLLPLLEKHPQLAAATTLRHTDQFITNDDRPSLALRNGRRSSMRLAIDAVRDGEATSVVSAGNTGALMAMSKFVLRTLPGIDRPAICSFFPTVRGETCMLDLGANVECDADNLVQFAAMGEIFARTVLGLSKPTVGILNVGVEDLKGKDEVRLAAAMIRKTLPEMNFRGFVEGDDIALGTVDVVVTDGFTGNTALKTAEGMAKMIATFLREAFQSSFLAKIGYIFASHAIQKLRNRVDPRRYNGAVFLGLNGIAVKSHGGTDSLGFANAINVAADMVSHGFMDKMRKEFESIKAEHAADFAADQPADPATPAAGQEA